MEKIKYSKFIAFFGLVFIWLLLIGRGGGSGFFGQINFIDEGQFLAWINQMMNGKLIYRDIYVQYGPLMVFPIYFLFQIFEPTVFILKTWQVLDAFIAFIVAFIVLRRFGVRSKLFYFVILSLIIIPGLSFRIWIGVLVILIAHFGYIKKSNKLLFLTGLLVPSLLFYSIDIGLFVLITLIVFLIINLITTKKISNSLKTFSFVLGGFFISLSGFIFIFQSQGWFIHYVSTTIAFSESIAGNNLPNGMGLPKVNLPIDFQNPLTFLKAMLSLEMLFYVSLFSIIYFLFLSIAGAIVRKDSRLYYLSFLISFYALLVFVSIVGRSGHYFAIVPFVIVVGAFFVSQIISSKEKIFGKSIKLLFLILFIAYTTRHISIFRFSIIPDFRNISFEKVERVYPFYTTEEQAYQIFTLQNYFSEAKEQIYILSNSPALYFLISQSNSTKYDLPLLAGSIEKRYDLVSQLKENPPSYIIEDTKAWAVDGVDDAVRMPEVFEFVEQNYKEHDYVANYKIYVLDEASDKKGSVE